MRVVLSCTQLTVTHSIGLDGELGAPHRLMQDTTAISVMAIRAASRHVMV